MKIFAMQQENASGVQASTIQVCPITTELWNATPLGMVHIGKVTTLREVWARRISSHIRSLLPTMVVRLSLIFPTDLQAYYLVDAGGNRLDAAPINIVRNPAASDPTVRNGLSCIGCHTEGMKTFEDQVRAVVEQNPNPPFDKARALRLYTEKPLMNSLVDEDTERYRQALEATGDVFGGIEPVQRFHEAFQGPVGASHAAAAVGLETETFLQRIRSNKGLQNLGLLVLANGTMKRDAWTSKFSEVVFALDFPSRSTGIGVDPQTEIIPGASVYIPDVNLRAAIAVALGKNANAPITAAEMATLTNLDASSKGIRNLIGLEAARNLIVLQINNNPISDLSPLAGLAKIQEINFEETEVADLLPLNALYNLEIINAGNTHISNLAPLARLKKLRKLDTIKSDISDLSPLAGLTNLTRLNLYASNVTNLLPLKHLTKLTWLGLRYVNGISDYSPLAGLTNLKHIDLFRNRTSDISMLAGLINLETLQLDQNHIEDVSPLASLHNLETLVLSANRIVDVSPLASLHNLKTLTLDTNNIVDFTSLEGIRKNLEVFRWYKNPGYPQGGPKIEGPWLWLLLPTPYISLDTGVDYLVEASDGKVTEQGIATLGATEGTGVGDNVWLAGALEPYNYDPKESQSNLDNLRRALHIKNKSGRVVVYASITLYSPRIQHTKMFIGAGQFPRKVWLNGQLVYSYEHYIDSERWNSDYQDFFPITLQKGKNVLLVRHVYKSYREISFFSGFAPDTEYMVENPSIGYAFSEVQLHAGDTFTFDISAENIIDLAGWQFDIAFDPAVLKAISVDEGDFLKTGGGTTFFQKGKIDNRSGKITGLNSARLSGDGVNGTGTLLSVDFSAKAAGKTQLKLQNFQFGSRTGSLISAGPHEVTIIVERQLTTGDINRDGQVSILDLILVANRLGETAPPNSKIDVNGDGVISILDLIVVAQHLGKSTEAASPAILTMDNIDGLDPAMVQAWIAQARLEDDGSIAFRQGIAYLQSLLALLIPEKTTLLPNYPNPFNPETWIPYQLSEPADVTLRIYAVNGELVRTLALGHTPAGIYQNRSRAVYWDGKNDVGESVASGVYFYTLTTGDFTATRKLLIRK